LCSPIGLSTYLVATKSKSKRRAANGAREMFDELAPVTATTPWGPRRQQPSVVPFDEGTFYANLPTYSASVTDTTNLGDDNSTSNQQIGNAVTTTFSKTALTRTLSSVSNNSTDLDDHDLDTTEPAVNNGEDLLQQLGFCLSDKFHVSTGFDAVSPRPMPFDIPNSPGDDDHSSVDQQRHTWADQNGHISTTSLGALFEKMQVRALSLTHTNIY
jgi:hypothetical protein